MLYLDLTIHFALGYQMVRFSGEHYKKYAGLKFGTESFKYIFIRCKRDFHAGRFLRITRKLLI